MELNNYEKCPKCNSLSNETDLSSNIITCTSCGYKNTANSFRNHEHVESYDVSNRKDFFGKNIIDSDENDYKRNLIKKLDIKF